MSKTFKSAESDNRELEVDVLCGSPRLLVKDFDGDSKGFIFGKADAPALALAILEAAGADSDLKWSGAKDYGNADHLGWIAGHLGAYIKTQERVTAEAKEQAELVNPDAVTRSIMGYQLRSSCLVEPAGECKACRSVVEAIITDYLAVAQQVVNSVEELDKLPAGSLIRAGGREFYKTSYIEHPWVLSHGVDRFGSGYLAKHSNVVVVHRPEVPGA